MQGLLGTSIDDPRTLGLLQMAAALSSGRKFMPALAQGLLARQQVVQGAADAEEAKQDRAMRRGLLDMQIKDAEQARAKRAGVEQWAQGLQLPANADPMLQQMHAGVRAGAVDPLQFLQMQQPKPSDFKVVGDALVSVGPGGVKEAYRAPAKPEAMPSAVREYQFAQQQGYKGTFQQFQLEKARAGASNTSVSYGTPVAAVDAQGNPVFVQPSKDGSAPHIIPGLRPPKSAAEERSASEQRDRARQGQQMLSVMKDAEAILKTGRATASGIGNVADIGARVVGVSTPGAQDAARLEALSGWLVANVPRMEGPQSNYDVQTYMTMAGKVGDRTTPIAERLAALEQVKGLQKKYADINGTPVSGERKVVRTGTQNGRKVVQYDDGSIEYAD